MGLDKLVVVTGKGIHSDNEKNPYTSKDFGISKIFYARIHKK